MPAPFATGSFAAERTRLELQVIRETVAGVHGSLVATSDGLLVAHDLPDSEPAQIAALAATTRALAASTTLATGRGEFLDVLARGSHGYLVVYAAGDTAIVAVVGSNDLNIGMLNYQARAAASRIAAYSPEFRGWAAQGGNAARPYGSAASTDDWDPGYPRHQGALPVRRAPGS